MQESYRKEVANHLASSFAAAVVRPLLKRRHEVSAGRVSSFEKINPGRRPCGQRGKAAQAAALTRVAGLVPRSRRPQAPTDERACLLFRDRNVTDTPKFSLTYPNLAVLLLRLW